MSGHADRHTDGRDHSRDRHRSRGRQLRRSIDAAAQLEAAERFAARFLSLEEITSAQSALAIGTYVATDSEIDPTAAVDALRRSGHSILLPVVTGRRSMAFGEWNGGDELAANRYGIPEPTGTELVEAVQLDMVLVPCVAIDPHGSRLGFGAGFYDRALADTAAVGPTARRSPLLVGVAHDVQLVDHVDTGDWDVRMHVVVTDQRVLRIPSPQH